MLWFFFWKQDLNTQGDQISHYFLSPDLFGAELTWNIFMLFHNHLTVTERVMMSVSNTKKKIFLKELAMSCVHTGQDHVQSNVEISFWWLNCWSGQHPTVFLSPEWFPLSEDALDTLLAIHKQLLYLLQAQCLQWMCWNSLTMWCLWSYSVAYWSMYL